MNTSLETAHRLGEDTQMEHYFVRMPLRQLIPNQEWRLDHEFPNLKQWTLKRFLSGQGLMWHTCIQAKSKVVTPEVCGVN